jgi:CDP-glucose 4,6-dehydratase
LSGYLALAVRAHDSPEGFSGAWNFGPHFSASVTVGALVDRFYELLGRGERAGGSTETDPRLHEAVILRLSVEKAREALGWQTLFGVDEAVAATAEWFRSVILEGGDARHQCLENIREYVELARARKAWWGRT